MIKLMKVLGAGPFSETEQGEIQRVVFVSTFALIARLVASDGDMGKKELILVDQLMKQTMKLDDAKRKFATKVFNESRKIDVPVSSLVTSYREALADKPKMYEWLLDILVRLSLADEVLVEEEESLLLEVCTLLGFNEHKLNEIQSRYVLKSNSGSGKDDAAYKLLGCGLTDSFEQIQVAYDGKMRKFDTERLIQAGFSSELVELAMKRQAEFTSAFLKIKKEREV